MKRDEVMNVKERTKEEQEFEIWMSGTLELSGPNESVIGSQVLEQFSEFMQGWCDPAKVNRISVSKMLAYEVTRRGWGAARSYSHRPVRWFGLRWRDPTLVQRLDKLTPQFNLWVESHLEVTGRPEDRMTTHDVLKVYETQGHVLDPEVNFGLMMREVARRRPGDAKINFLPGGHGIWVGLRWRNEPGG